MNNTTSIQAGERTHLLTLAESILIQADSDLSDSGFRKYILRIAQQEIEKGPALPAKLTIEHGIEVLWMVKDLCDSIESDYETAKDDPENDVSGYHATDLMEELVHGCEDEILARKIVEIGLGLEAKRP